jgi:ribonuclease PH
MRPVRITPNYMRNAEGSALIELGNTRVICAASVEERVPPFLLGKGQGWVTAEYGMLPRSTTTRMQREAGGRISGRTQEIQRLIGRSLRAALDLKKLGERSIYVDCDVIEADGGTRTASITGGWVALALAIETLLGRGLIAARPKLLEVAATSVGIVAGRPMLDLAYEEDSTAEVDFNVVMTGGGDFVEIQGTAERGAFSRAMSDRLLDLAQAGVQDLVRLQGEAVRSGRGS